MSVRRMPGTDLRVPSTHPAESLLAGHTDHLILKAYAGHHPTNRRVPPRSGELNLIPIGVKNSPTQVTHSVVIDPAASHRHAGGPLGHSHGDIAQCG